MKKYGWLVVVVIGLILLLAGCGSYNRLVNLSQGVDAQWAQVQSQYQRRYDLIPNLVQTVSGAANFEKSTLVDVTQARASVGQVQVNQNQAPANAAELEKFDAAQGQLSSALSRLLVVVERYPELKANANFRDLQAQLEGTETESRWNGCDSTKRCRNTMSLSRHSPTLSTQTCLGFSRSPISNPPPERRRRPRCSLISAGRTNEGGSCGEPPNGLAQAELCNGNTS